MDPYRSPVWKAFRSEVIRLDGNQCAQCGRTPDSGVTLHVHHKAYRQGKLPWEYDFDECETLCAGCHAAHHGKIPPKVGWEFVGQDDLGDLIGNCELCGTDIRYVFLVTHSNWMPMEVGEICCDHLTCSEIASNFMESIRRYNNRRKRFATSNRWTKISEKNEYIVQAKVVVELRSEQGELKLRMNGRCGKLSYVDKLQARMKAFDVIESGKHSKFIEALRQNRKPLYQIINAA